MGWLTGVHGKDINRKDINAYFAKNAKDIKSILFKKKNNIRQSLYA